MIKSGLRTSRHENLYLGKGEDSGILFLYSNTSLPDLGSNDRAFGFQSATPKYWTGSSWSTSWGGGGGTSTWDDIYSNDKTLTIDSTTLTFALTHATNDGLTVTGSAGSAGDCIQITNSGTGSDIEGTSGTWTVSKAGAAVFTAITGCDTLTAAANMAIDATGAGTITLAGTSTGAITLTTATTCSASLTVGTTLTVGTGATFSDGLVDIVDNSNAASSLRVTNDTVTTYGNAADAGVVVFRSETLSTGTLLHLSVDETGMAGGYFFRCWSQDLGSAAFTIGEYGVTTIAGAAAGGANAFVITAGDAVMSDGSLTITDADSAATVVVTNDTISTTGAAADTGMVSFTSESLSTGVLLNLSLDETNLAGGFYLRCYGQDAAAAVFTVGEYGATTITTASSATSLTISSASATSDVLSIATTALTTGDAVQITSTAETLAAGELLKINNTESGDLSATPKTGNLVSITSSVTATTADTALDYDAMLITRSNIMNQGTKTLTASGSVLKLMNTSTNTAGTCTDTTVILEILAADGGTAAPTGDCVKVTSVGVGAKAINVVSASTTASDVLLTGSGAKADNKAVLEITSTGATAAGGSLFRVATTSGTPAAATSYLVDFDYASATMTNNPITISVNSGSSTGAALNITGSGAGYSLATYNTGTGATGVLWFTEHTSTGSAADNDVVFRHTIGGLSDTDVARNYARVDVTAIDVSNATEDAKYDIQIMVGGTLTSQLYVQSSTAGATTLVAAAAASTFAGSAAGTAAITVTNGDVSLSAGKFISTTTADIYGLDVTVNRAAATQGVAVFTNSSATSAKSVLELEQADLDKPYIKFSGATAITSATAGANGDVPAQVVGYLNVDIDGTERRIPYYSA